MAVCARRASGEGPGGAERVGSAAAVIHQGSSGCGASNCAQC